MGGAEGGGLGWAVRKEGGGPFRIRMAHDGDGDSGRCGAPLHEKSAPAHEHHYRERREYILHVIASLPVRRDASRGCTAGRQVSVSSGV